MSVGQGRHALTKGERGVVRPRTEEQRDATSIPGPRRDDVVDREFKHQAQRDDAWLHLAVDRTGRVLND
jgi:hypothetical protein